MTNYNLSGDWSKNAFKQANKLVKRMKKVPDYRKKWKLITVALGGNDICTHACGAKKSQATPKAYTKNMKKMLNLLSKKLPRSIILILDPIDFPKYQNVTNPNYLCNLIMTERYL